MASLCDGIIVAQLGCLVKLGLDKRARVCYTGCVVGFHPREMTVTPGNGASWAGQKGGKMAKRPGGGRRPADGRGGGKGVKGGRRSGKNAGGCSKGGAGHGKGGGAGRGTGRQG